MIGAYNGVLGRLRLSDTLRLAPALVNQFNRQVMANLELPPEVRPRRSTPALSHGRPLPRARLGPRRHAHRADVRVVERAGLLRRRKRTARRCEFLVLVTSGVPHECGAPDLGPLRKTRDEYYRQLQYASESGGDVTGFVSYCAAGFVDGLGDQVRGPTTGSTGSPGTSTSASR